LSADLQDTVGINVEGTQKLRNTTGGGDKTRKFEFTEKVVLLGHETLTFVDGELDLSLVIGSGGENLGLLGGDRGIAGNNNSHDTTLHFNTERERDNIQKKEVLGLLVTSLVGKDSSLDGSTIGNSLIRVDGLVQLLTVKEVLKERLNLGNTGRTTNEDNFVDILLIDLGILEDTGNGIDSAIEVKRVDLLELGTGDVGLEVNTIEKRVDLNGGLGERRQGTLSTLGGSAKTTKGTGIARDVLLLLALELLNKVVDKGVIEIFTTKMGVTSGGLDSEDTTRDGQKRNIESTTTQIEDEDVLLLLVVSIKTVGDGCD
jgi:hypothetical protein